MTARYILVSGIILTLLGCQQSTHNVDAILVSPDTVTNRRTIQSSDSSTHQYIYDFMKVVIADQKLDLTHGLDIEPDRASDLFDWEIPFIDKNDIHEMLLQKEKLKNFFWDNAKLGFNSSNRDHWYSFSIPLFSKDRKKMVIKIEDLCTGLCGGGGIYVFNNENNKWTSTITSTISH
jgi:hypothetical protein